MLGGLTVAVESDKVADGWSALRPAALAWRLSCVTEVGTVRLGGRAGGRRPMGGLGRGRRWIRSGP